MISVSFAVVLALLVSMFQQITLQFNQTSFFFIPPGEIQEEINPTTIDWIHSYYIYDNVSLEMNKKWYQQMMASGFTCELYEPQLQESPEYPNGDRFSPWNSPYSHVDCFQVPIFPKKYYLPNWSLTINEPLIADWRSKQYDPQRSGQLVVSGNFLYSFIYDSNHPEQQELSDHKSKDFSFFFMIGYRDEIPYHGVENFIREWAKLISPNKHTDQFVFKEENSRFSTFSGEVKTIWVYKNKNDVPESFPRNSARALFTYSLRCLPEKKQCLVLVDARKDHVWGTVTNYFGKISPFGG